MLKKSSCSRQSFLGKAILEMCQFIHIFLVYCYPSLLDKQPTSLTTNLEFHIAVVPLFGTYSDNNPRLKIKQYLIWEIVSFLGECIPAIVLFSISGLRFRVLYYYILLYMEFGSLFPIFNLLSFFFHQWSSHISHRCKFYLRHLFCLWMIHRKFHGESKNK